MGEKIFDKFGKKEWTLIDTPLNDDVLKIKPKTISDMKIKLNFLSILNWKKLSI